MVNLSNFFNASKRNKNLQLLFILLLSFIVSTQFLLRLKFNNTNIADLGFLFSNLFSTYNEPERIFYTHAQPILLFFSYFFNIFPESYVLLIYITSLFIISYVAIYFKNNYGFIHSLIFLFYTPTWVIFTYDFHFDVLTLPLLIIYYKAVDKNNFLLFLLSTIIISLIKEPYALVSSMCAIYYLWHNKFNINNSLKIKLIFISFIYLCYFFASVFWIIPHYSNNANSGFSGPGFNYFKDNILNGVLKLSDPLLLKEKAKTFIIIFGSLFFVPLLRLKYLFIVSPIILIYILTISEGQASYINHYSSPLIICSLFAAFSFTSKFKYKKYLLILLLLNTITINLIFGPIYFGRFFFSNYYEFNYKRYQPNPNLIENSIAIKTNIPDDKNIILSVQNNINSEFISKRVNIFLFPAGITSLHANFSSKTNNYIKYYLADYVIIDNSIPLFLYDKGCSWYNNHCNNNIIDLEYNKLLLYLYKNFDLLYLNNGFMIFKRK